MREVRIVDGEVVTLPLPVRPPTYFRDRLDGNDVVRETSPNFNGPWTEVHRRVGAAEACQYTYRAPERWIGTSSQPIHRIPTEEL